MGTETDDPVISFGDISLVLVGGGYHYRALGTPPSKVFWSA